MPLNFFARTRKPCAQPSSSRRTRRSRDIAAAPYAIEPLEQRVLLTVAPLKYDFGTATSPLQSGYTRVAETTTYNATAGYGWISGSGEQSR